MTGSASISTAAEDKNWQVLWENPERVFGRLRFNGASEQRYAFIPVVSRAEQPTIEIINRFNHEYQLKDLLDPAWALRPVELIRDDPSQPMLVGGDTAGEP